MAAGFSVSVPLRAPASADDPERLQRMAAAHFAFVWRVLRRLGASPDAANDGAQEVFVVAARRIGDIVPGRERAFLAGTARRVAKALRRAPRIETAHPGERMDTIRADEPSPEELSDRKRAREQLDAILESMDEDLRDVFVLYEIEEMTLPEIAELISVPLGTVTSRLRRGREAFEARCKRLQERAAGRGGQP
jgi:RNA polymerase sigma-70 factor (ECF subfamily)